MLLVPLRTVSCPYPAPPNQASSLRSDMHWFENQHGLWCFSVGRHERHHLSLEGYVSAFCDHWTPAVSIDTEALHLHELHPNLHREPPTPPVYLPSLAHSCFHQYDPISYLSFCCNRIPHTWLKRWKACLDSQRHFSPSQWGRQGGVAPIHGNGSLWQ